jgi:hypothetical protein
MATGSTMVVAWLEDLSGPMQVGGGSVQCGRREKRALVLLTSSGGRQLCSKATTTNNGRRRGGVAPGRRRRGRRPAWVALGGDLCMGKLSSEQWRRPVQSNPSGGAVNLPVRTTATGWCGNVDRGGEVAASNWPGQNGRAYKGTRHRASGAAHGARCPAASDRRSRAEGTTSDKWVRSYLISNRILNTKN